MDIQETYEWVESVLSSGVKISEWAKASGMPGNGSSIRNYLRSWERGEEAGFKARTIEQLEKGLKKLGREDLLPEKVMEDPATLGNLIHLVTKRISKMSYNEKKAFKYAIKSLLDDDEGNIPLEPLKVKKTKP